MDATPIVLSAAQRRRRSAALAVILGAYVLSFFHRFAPAAIAQDLVATFSITAAAMGALASTYFYVYTIMQVPTGVLVDTIGPRRILFAGGLAAAAGSLTFALAPTFALAFAGRTLIGLGVSVVFIAMLKILAVWFEEGRFATLVGLCLLLGNLGSVLAGAPLSLLAQSVGWRGVFAGVGVLSLLLALACWIFVRDRPEGAHAASRSTPSPADRGEVRSGLVAVLKNPATWPCVAVSFAIAGGFFTFGGLWGAPYLMQVQGLSRAQASAHLSVYFASFAFGSLCLGTLSDRIGRRKPVLIVATHFHALVWMILLSGLRISPPASYVFFVVLGVATASFTLTWACAKEVNPPALSGMSTSVANMGAFLSPALLQPFVGWLMDLRWHGAMEGGVRVYSSEDIRISLVVLAALAWFGAAASWRVRETRGRNVWRVLPQQT
jgi:predicted MFS family arabinose efflux permease